MSVFKCTHGSCHLGAGAVAVNYYQAWHGHRHTTLLLCREHLNIEQPHIPAGVFRVDYLHDLHEPVPGDELSIAVECWLHNLVSYCALMPELLAQKRRAA